MNKYLRPIIALVIILLSFLVSFGLWNTPKVLPADSDGFSAVRVKNGLITSDSLLFLYGKRLSDLGGVPLYNDSTGEGASGCAFDFPVNDSSIATTRLLLVSRGDGYGASVELEALLNALKFRDAWKQGVRVLMLTESNGLDDSIYNSVYENVGLAIYLDAKSPSGSAMLYRTSGGINIMKLYSKASYPRTYTVFNSFEKNIPVDSGFEAVKGKVPSMLFTDAGSLKGQSCEVPENTIQQYGEQLIPMIKEYLTSSVYSDPAFLSSSDVSASFTMPFVGLVSLSRGQNYLFNSLLLLLFCISFCFSIIRGRLKPARAILKSAAILIWSVAIFAICLLLRRLEVASEGYALVIALLSVIFVITLVVYLWLRHKCALKATRNSLRSSASSNSTAHYAYSVLYGTLIVAVVVATVSIFTLKDDFFIAVPLFFTLAGMILWRITTLREFLLVSVAGILIYSIPFLYTCIIVSPVGQLPGTVTTAFYNLLLLIVLTDLYVRRDKAI
ncbi:MAG: hypothetical protein LKJ93_04040 [Bacteroidales bacterium]|jgi:hypothetical protein|nr:hypothetical protein [Bacteroidales bacterium]